MYDGSIFQSKPPTSSCIYSRSILEKDSVKIQKKNLTVNFKFDKNS